ncbi:MAG: 30S ribosomal protein S12 methylthiotransferase RimO [Eubacterium sp.]|nr:30S ribosomal protein S12 methylthiotransferase RimO [Eubacterium sp.]
MNLLFISLGCDKNLVDSEYMIGMLQAAGYTITDDEYEADVIIVNSCCFIGDAKEESIQTILSMAQLKQTGKLKSLIVTGCLAQRYQDEVLAEIPEVDAVIGTNAYDNIVEAVTQTLEGNVYKNYRALEGFPNLKDGKRLVTTGGHYAYLKIAEGCNKHCSYCIIPSIRGAYRSIPMEQLLTQARELAAQGVRELILVAQETTLYGIDLYGEKSLYRLLDELNKIEELYWIRIMYCYPEEIDETLVSAIKRNEKVVHYLDMPIQHVNDDVLKRMGRRTTGAELADKIEYLRQEIPDICLRTTLICGFPGETEQAHEELLEFLNWAEFDRLGAFAYSPEEDTPAAEFANQIDEETKLTWRDEVMELQQEISYDLNESMKGRELWAFVEGKVANENAYIARTYKDAPGVDGYIFIHTDETLVSGDFVKIRVTGAYEYDLIGEIV